MIHKLCMHKGKKKKKKKLSPLCASLKINLLSHECHNVTTTREPQKQTFHLF